MFRPILLLILISLTIVFSALPKLYTRTRSGKYIRILNRKGGITKFYDGGIFIAHPDGTYEAVHKATKRGYIERRRP